MTRDKIIQTIYRSLRDSINTPAQHVAREKNSVVFYVEGKKVSVSFRIKQEPGPPKIAWTKKEEQ